MNSGTRNSPKFSQSLIWFLVMAMMLVSTPVPHVYAGSMLIDDFLNADLVSKLGTRWRGVSDRVMGGISQASVYSEKINDRSCLRLNGDVRLENNGGFIQASLDLAPSDDTLDASNYTGIRLIVYGNGEQYSVHLRTPDNVRPWQSYRAHFAASPTWAKIEIPFSDFVPHRLEAPLDVKRLCRIGLVAIGRGISRRSDGLGA